MIANNHEIVVIAIEINNLQCGGMFAGQSIPRGCLNMKINREPNFIYKQVGNVIFAEDNGLVSAYLHDPNSKDGFAGREIVLPMKGGKVFKNKGVTKKSFKGTLWDSSYANKKAAEILGTELFHVGLKHINQNVDIYCSCMVNKEFMDQIAKHVVIGDPKMTRDVPGCVNSNNSRQW